MNKMIAKEDFESQDGKFSKGEELLVNDERAQVLLREGKAERAADQTIAPPKGEQFGVAPHPDE